MANTFRCTIVSPADKLLEEQITYASIPLWDGLMGILPGRAPIVASLGTGELRVDFPGDANAAGGSRSYFVDGGVCKMSEGSLTLIAETAVPAESLVLSDCKAELQEAEAVRASEEGDHEARRIAHERRTQAIQAARAKVRLAESRVGKGI